MRKPVLTLILSTALIATTSIIPVSADPAKNRHDQMAGVGKSMKALGGIVRGKTPFNGPEVEKLGNKIKELLAAAQNEFPEGSASNKSRAKDTIWSDPEGFKKAFVNSIDAAAGVAATGTEANEAAFKVAFGKLGGTCKACHEDYRGPEIEGHSH